MFKAVVDQAVAQHPRRVVLLMNDRYHISPEGVRVLVFASEHLDPDVEIYGIGATPDVVEAFRDLELDDDIIWLGDYDAARIERSWVGSRSGAAPAGWPSGEAGAGRRARRVPSPAADCLGHRSRARARESR
ncbi:MAG: hypothetical protein HY691_15485 [Chloroflexi bacterium]|nr:hypothetical protein [Chloroflexota bacterium]